MEMIGDRGTLQRAMSTIPRKAPDFTTNLYVSPETVDQWCAVGRMCAIKAPGAILILRNDRGFWHVYHAAESPAALTHALRLLPRGIYTADLLGEGARLDNLSQAYADGGFERHTSLVRMVRVQAPAPAYEGKAEEAGSADILAVAALLERLLDRLAEQLPDVAELTEAALDHRLLIARNPDGVIGLLMYDRQGQSAHLRYWHVDPDARDAGVGRGLMRAFLARCAAARRIVLWVIADNQRSIAIYQHYGFAADGLLDRIMTMHRDS